MEAAKVKVERILVAAPCWTTRAANVLLGKFDEPTPQTMRSARLFHWVGNRMRSHKGLAPLPLSEWTRDVK